MWCLSFSCKPYSGLEEPVSLISFPELRGSGVYCCNSSHNSASNSAYVVVFSGFAASKGAGTWIMLDLSFLKNEKYVSGLKYFYSVLVGGVY